MAKKKARKSPTVVPMTKRQLSRYQKEKRQERLALGFVIVVVLLIVAVIAAGFFQEGIAKPNATVAKVNGTSVTAGAWAKAMVLQSRNLDNQLAYWDNQRLALGGGTDSGQAYLQQIIEQQKQQIQQAQQQLIYTVPDQLIANELIRQEAEKRGIAVTPADMDAAVRDMFQPTPREPVTDTASTTPTPTAIPANAWEQNYKQYLATLGVSDGEYRQIALLPGLQREKLQVVLSETMATSAEQIRVSHIVTDTEDVAKSILARVQAGEDFATLARDLSGDTATTEIGGDLGWYPREILSGEYGPDAESAAWALQKGQVVTAPVQSYSGYEIIKVTDREANRPLDSDKLAQLQGSVLENWLTAQMASPAVERFTTSDVQLWVQAQVTKALQALAKTK
ncbi:MAG: peptidylprolyl isomerase [Chloroflexota bacterium]|nr:peptidylprolyl isomerase [Chloroflexota bacterium]